jgi:hypothetical protein
MDKVQMYQTFIEFIIDEYAHNRRTVLIVDEAQNMSAETLEELRMLSNVNADKDQALQVVLVGQNELRDTLKRPDLVQFAQRISVDYHLKPLSEEETANYIRHRLKVVGGRENIFSDAACKAVHLYSNGVPRLINLLCDTALVYGFAEEKYRIDANLITQVAKEKQQGGIFPTFHAAQDEDFPEEEPLSAEEIEHIKAESAEQASRAVEPILAKQDAPPDELTETTETSPSEDKSAPTRTSAQKSEGEIYWEQQVTRTAPKKKRFRFSLFARKAGSNH